MMNATEFKNLVLPLCGKLHRFAFFMLKDNSEAEDAVQEVCMKLWNNRESLESIKSIDAFAMRMIKNWCLDRLKAKKPVYVESYQPWLEKSSEMADPQKSLETADKLNRLNGIMNKLPEQQRIIVQLREIEGLEFNEISEITELDINNIRVNLSRARNRIREEMNKFESNEYHSDKTITGKIL
jgi:RNA polymerase sigma factor (sigma-70 family)